jgi:hypothetical protein
MAGKHRGPVRSVFEGVERLGDFAASGYSMSRPRGVVQATLPSQDRVAIRSDFNALRIGLIDAIDFLAPEGWSSVHVPQDRPVDFSDLIEDSDIHSIAVTRTDEHGRVWRSWIKVSASQAEIDSAATPAFDATVREFARDSDSHPVRLWTRDSIITTQRTTNDENGQHQ